jgi:hypothetical protein
MARMLLPMGQRSPTAVSGRSDITDQNIYSALVVQHSGSGSQKVFTVPQGQAIPKMNGTVTASANAHHGNYSELTTNLTKAGEFGSGLGDGSIRGIGITFEQAAFNAANAAAGSARGFGATQFEVADILAKTSFELRVGGKRQIIGPTFTYPNAGAAVGAIATTANAATLGIVNNGSGGLRKLKVPVPVGRDDTIEGEFKVASGASLAFSVTGSDGQPLLVGIVLFCTVKGDVR